MLRYVLLRALFAIDGVLSVRQEDFSIGEEHNIQATGEAPGAQ
jgi:hypothetical protein